MVYEDGKTKLNYGLSLQVAFIISTRVLYLHQPKSKPMEIPNAVRLKAIDLIGKGKSVEAIHYVRQELNLSTQEAHAIINHLEKERSHLKRSTIQKGISIPGGGPILKIFGIIFLVAGVTCLGIIGSYAWDEHKFIENGIYVMATVISIEESESVDDEGRSSKGYFPVFEYSYKGVKGTHRSTINFGRDNYSIGETVAAYIDPTNPGNVVIDTFTERWGSYFLFSLFALMGTIMGFVMIRIS